MFIAKKRKTKIFCVLFRVSKQSTKIHTLPYWRASAQYVYNNTVYTGSTHTIYIHSFINASCPLHISEVVDTMD